MSCYLSNCGSVYFDAPSCLKVPEDLLSVTIAASCRQLMINFMYKCANDNEQNFQPRIN